MENNKQCDGRTSFGFTTEECDQPATRHAYQDKYEQYDFCEKHYFFYIHGHSPDIECKNAVLCNLRRPALRDNEECKEKGHHWDCAEHDPEDCYCTCCGFKAMFPGW